MEKVLTVSQEFTGKRLDVFLNKSLDSVSRTKINKLINENNVTVNGLVKKPSFHVSENMEVKVIIPPDDPITLLPYPGKLDIIYEDADIIVLDKPQGVTTHPPHEGINDTLVNILIYLKRALSPINPLRPGIVHRLDKETSGVMVVAKTDKAYLNLVNQFRRRLVKKEYRAIVWGTMEKDTTSVDLPISRDSRNRLKMKISFVNAKNALTDVRVLERFNDSTYLSVDIHTGRMHQIRVHMKFLEFPIVGDKKYGITDNYNELFLHAYKLGIYHPVNNNFMEFEAKLPERFTKFIGSRISNFK